MRMTCSPFLLVSALCLAACTQAPAGYCETPADCEPVPGSSEMHCIENACVPVLEPGPAPTNPEGNPGAACATDSECVTPTSYLIRSNCPFTSRCLENTCAVVCPMAFGASVQTELCQSDSDCDCGHYAEGGNDCRCADGSCYAVMRQEH